MASLKDVGINKDSPAEVIFTTCSPDGTPHASAMGVRANNDEYIFLRIFRDTQTYQNILATKSGVINITRNAELLTKIALPEIVNFDRRELKFKKSRHLKAPRLAGAEASIDVEIVKLSETKFSDEIGTSMVVNVKGRVKNIEVHKPSVLPFRRTDSFLVETAILATKAIEALRRDRMGVARKLLAKITEYGSECKRVAPESRHSYLIEKIKNSLKERLGE